MKKYHNNRPLYFYSSLIILALGLLYWTFNGPADSSDNTPASTDIVASTGSAPLAEAVLPETTTKVSLSTDLKPEDTVSIDVIKDDAPLVTVPVPVVATTSEIINIAVPFTSQAPLGKWSDERQQDGCEETSVLMAMAWVNGESTKTPAEWEKEILALVDFETEKYGEHRDISVQDTLAWMIEDYFGYDGASIKEIKNSAEIVAELEKGNLVLVPVNGRALKNPNFTAPGPEHHFILIKGYDPVKREFITNDPGTRRGADYRYGEQLIFDALRSYPTGYQDHYDDLRKEAIIVTR